MIKEVKKQQLEENYRMGGSEISFKDWIQQESENDPNFFAWLFDLDDDTDYFGLSDEQSKDFEDFMSNL